jgi:hypothetical protein
MSWRTGARLFAEIWPAVEARVTDRRIRQQFLGELLALFLKWDTDPEDLADIDGEVQEALIALGAVADGAMAELEGDEVKLCATQLRHGPDDKARTAAAQAIEFYVHQADEPAAMAAVALTALVEALRDQSTRVRRAAAKSLDGLLADGFVLPEAARAGLQAGLDDKDAVVRKRVEKALKRVG